MDTMNHNYNNDVDTLLRGLMALTPVEYGQFYLVTVLRHYISNKALIENSPLPLVYIELPDIDGAEKVFDKTYPLLQKGEDHKIIYERFKRLTEMALLFRKQLQQAFIQASTALTLTTNIYQEAIDVEAAINAINFFGADPHTAETYKKNIGLLRDRVEMVKKNGPSIEYATLKAETLNRYYKLAALLVPAIEKYAQFEDLEDYITLPQWPTFNGLLDRIQEAQNVLYDLYEANGTARKYRISKMKINEGLYNNSNGYTFSETEKNKIFEMVETLCEDPSTDLNTVIMRFL